MRKDFTSVSKTYRIAASIVLFSSLLCFLFTCLSDESYKIFLDSMANSGPWGLFSWGILSVFILFSFWATFEGKLRDSPDFYFGIVRAVFISFSLITVIWGVIDGYWYGDRFVDRVMIMSLTSIQIIHGYSAGLSLLGFAVSFYLLRCRKKPHFDLFFIGSIIFTLLSLLLVLCYIPFSVLFHLAKNAGG